MRNKRFQNLVSKSSLTLPLCLVIGLLVWFWDAGSGSYKYSHSSLVALLLFLATAYVITETSTTFSLLRVRSRMITCVWLLGASLIPFIHVFSYGWIAAAAMAGSYHIMFLSYQEHEPVTHVFHTFLLLGCAILFVPELVILIPLYYWYMLVMLRCMSWRSLWAGLVGILCPFCFTIGWSILSEDYRLLQSWITTISDTHPFFQQDYIRLLSYTNVETQQCIFWGVLSLISIIHFMQTYYNDKIRTRMYLYIYVVQTAVCWLVILALPDRLHIMFPIMLMNVSTLIAHYFTLTCSRLSNAFFCLTLLAYIGLLTYNLRIWTH